MCDKLKEHFFWKGKRVTEKIYNLRLRQASVGKTLQKLCQRNQKKNADDVEDQSNLQNQEKSQVEGRRIVHIETLGKELVCINCKQTLSLANIVQESRIGLACIWIVKCQQCQCTTRVNTDKVHKNETVTKKGKVTSYDVNTAGAIGNINFHFNKR